MLKEALYSSSSPAIFALNQFIFATSECKLRITNFFGPRSIKFENIKKSKIELILEKILNYKQAITLGPKLISSINPNLYNLIAFVLPLQFRLCVGLNFGFDF